MADVLAEISEFLQKGNAAKVKELTQQAVDSGMDVGKILNEGLLAGMGVIGGKFKRNEVYVPEVLIAARAMHAGMEILEPLLASGGVEPLANVAVGTVKGDLHDIGKNLVIMMLKGGGFNVTDLGIDVPAEKFVEYVEQNNCKLLGLSALLTTTMPQMADVVKAFEAKGLKDKVKIMIGGAPVTQSYADEIKADGYAPDAASAVDVAKELLGLA